MTPDEARCQALGYAWGTEDATNRKTSPAADGRPAEVGSWSFARAYAKAVASFNALTPGDSAYLPSVSSAYQVWQESAGATIYRAELERS
jgi:hypothetical protein